MELCQQGEGRGIIFIIIIIIIIIMLMLDLSQVVLASGRVREMEEEVVGGEEFEFEFREDIDQVLNCTVLYTILNCTVRPDPHRGGQLGRQEGGSGGYEI